jgi:hypothetical protein
MADQQIATAKVTNLLSDNQIAINRGSAAGVQAGDVVTLNNKVEIIDPDSNESLGHVLTQKLRLSVDFAAEKYSVASVTSRQKGDVYKLAFIPQTKTITQDTLEASENCILVTVGEEVRVTRKEVEKDEPAF